MPVRAGRFCHLGAGGGEAAPDLIYSNAALHWVGGHETLFPRLVSLLAPGGVLAVQMPAMHDAPLRRLQNEVAAYGPWASVLRDAGFARAILTAGEYYDLLRPHVAALDLWETTYLHVLSGEDAVVEWAAGSSLRPFLDKLPEGLRAGIAPRMRRRCGRIIRGGRMARRCCRSGGCSSSRGGDSGAEADPDRALPPFFLFFLFPPPPPPAPPRMPGADAAAAAIPRDGIAERTAD